MKKNKLILFAIIGVCVITATSFTLIKANGIQWRTGSPWDGSTCSSCHSGGATSPTLNITAVPAFGTGNKYLAGTTYTITATVAGSYPSYGFNLEIINSTAQVGAKDAGVLGAILTSNAQIYSHTTNPSTLSHNAASNGIYSFTWTAPDSGAAYLYFAGLGVNVNGATSGDKVSTTSMTLTPVSSVDIKSYPVNDIDLTIFPNPTKDNFYITYNLMEKGTVLVELYDMRGNFICHLFSDKQGVGLQRIHANLPIGIEKGIYTIVFTLNDKIINQKLMVL